MNNIFVQTIIDMKPLNDFPPDELALLVKFIDEYGHGAEVLLAESNCLVFRAPVGHEHTITYTGNTYAYQQWGRSAEWQQALADCGFSVPDYTMTPSRRSADRRFDRGTQSCDDPKQELPW